jgi:hypothetical protein
VALREPCAALRAQRRRGNCASPERNYLMSERHTTAAALRPKPLNAVDAHLAGPRRGMSHTEGMLR